MQYAEAHIKKSGDLTQFLDKDVLQQKAFYKFLLKQLFIQKNEKILDELQ